MKATRHVPPPPVAVYTLEDLTPTEIRVLHAALTYYRDSDVPAPAIVDTADNLHFAVGSIIELGEPDA